jgi:putative thiamine transport system ATP-binding protein
LKLNKVSLQLQGRSLFPPLNLTVHPGEVITVMGPSGCGKSALLSFICGTLVPAFHASGSVQLGERELTGLAVEQRRLGILFQDALLFPHLTVAGNLAFGLRPGQSRRIRRLRVETALLDTGLADFGHRNPATLSGGQRARVALMRTLLAEPEALLLDEPFSNLDAELRIRIRTFVFEHARQRGLPTLLVTHDPADAEAARGPVIALDSDTLLNDVNPMAASANPEDPETDRPLVPHAPYHP